MFIQDGEPIPMPGGRFAVEITPDEVIIIDTKAEKDDTGSYGVTLTNEKGKDHANIQVNVRGPPGIPNGPLEITDIHAEKCTLTWKPPTVSGRVSANYADWMTH